MTAAPSERLTALCAEFRLPTLAAELVPRLVAAGHDALIPLVAEIFELEAGDRHERRVDRLLRMSKLPPGKTLDTLDEARLPRPLLQQVRELARGEFVDRAANVLAFGLPGVGKSHVAAAIGHALVSAGRSVLFAPTYQLVQELLAAKRDLALPRALAKLDLFDLVVLDDIGYVQQAPDEIEVLFTLLAERYERRSVLITSNLVFSEWGQIFKNPMTTAAAIDRLVHHSVILEFAQVPSYRSDRAGKPTEPPTTSKASRASRSRAQRDAVVRQPDSSVRPPDSTRAADDSVRQPDESSRARSRSKSRRKGK